MSRLPATVAVSLLLAGCAMLAPGSSTQSATTLKRADDQMAAAQYRSALALYDEFLKASPNDPEAARARATRTVVERLLASQTEVERLRREVSSRQAEVDRLRRDADSRQAEIDRLKADLERLRRIDLRQSPAPR
ncbi:MAG: hypothetical protein HY359_03020 [Candidatus Rokubacteria bacterium]|nr:hypothetical protein [Candidatus Rokubacteria bacterium]